MTRFRKFLLPFAVTFVLSWAGLVLAQGSPGGSFLTAYNYVITGQWTYQGQAIPLRFKGTTRNNPYTTSVTVASPTANRAWALPDLAGGNFVGTTGAQTLATKTLTAPVISTVTNTGTLTLPTATGGVPVALNCGATGTGNQTCAPTAATALTKVYAGSSTMSSNAAVITFPTAFAATSSYQCVANDITTRANPVQMVSTSVSTATITNSTGASDVINWICAGQ